MDNCFLYNYRYLIITKILWVLIFAVIVQTSFGIDPLSLACAYPHFSDRRLCGIHDKNLLNGWICDPDNTMSMSEVYVIDDTLRRVYAQNEHNCQCPTNKKKPCWYKFAFAFLRELTYPSNNLLRDGQTNYKCRNKTKTFEKYYDAGHRNYSSLNAETAFLYAQNYVRVLREQWNIGACGEDILILVVQIPPEPLVSKQLLKSASNRHTLPMLFVSYGAHVVKYFGIEDTYTLPYALEPLRRIVDEENSNLQNAYPLNKVLNSLVLRTVEALQNVENTLHNSPHPKHHVPFWAWVIFAVCGITFFFMAIGLCLIRTRTRRNVQRAKPSIVDPGRRWKAGFVGEDNQPTTYVNLVNMMMPHQKTQTSNLQQQV